MAARSGLSIAHSAQAARPTCKWPEIYFQVQKKLQTQYSKSLAAIKNQVICQHVTGKLHRIT